MCHTQITGLNLPLDPNFVEKEAKTLLNKMLQLYDINGQNLRMLKSRYVVKISRLPLTFKYVCVYPYFVQYKGLRMLIL
jgi:hypothetical protein